MAGLFKKALGIFVEFDEDSHPQNDSGTTPTPTPTFKSQASSHVFNASEIDKFEKHFEKMFEQANLPGPDYYEFWRMMDTLEAHIPDEKARISATFASLSIQGLTKDKLIETANQYKNLVQTDKANFEKVANEKGEKEIGQKKVQVKAMEEKIAQHAEMIKKLTKEITESQHTIVKLKSDITEEENKLGNNKNGYMTASEAMISKIVTDIQKIQTTL
jgi:hypothetical protein